MSTKFTLQPKPTFKAVVSIPRPGDEDGKLTITFRHMPLADLAALEQLDNKTAIDFLTDIVAGWALPEECSRENLETLLQNYPGAMHAITRTFYDELLGNREKN